jgi:hypothetical protein
MATDSQTKVSYAHEAPFFGKEAPLRDEDFDSHDVLLILTDVDPC